MDSNIVDIILDELVRAATDGGIGTRRHETVSYCGSIVFDQCSRENIFEAAQGASYGLDSEIIC